MRKKIWRIMCLFAAIIFLNVASYSNFRFGSLEDARSYLRAFFQWYNTHHRHSGLAMMTPEVVHTGQDKHVWEKRKQTMKAAYEKHPKRFVNGEPDPHKVPQQVWINPPKKRLPNMNPTKNDLVKRPLRADQGGPQMKLITPKTHRRLFF